MYLIDDETYERLIRLQEVVNYSTSSTIIRDRFNDIISKIGYMKDDNFYIRSARRKAKIKRGE